MNSEELESLLKAQEETLEMYLSKLKLDTMPREQVANIFLSRAHSYLQRWIKHRDADGAAHGAGSEELSAEKDFFCSFCGRSYREVGPLVEGPSDVNICEQCVELCQHLIQEDKKRKREENSKGTQLVSGRNSDGSQAPSGASS